MLFYERLMPRTDQEHVATPMERQIDQAEGGDDEEELDQPKYNVELSSELEDVS
jgi:hypothetical protein